ncbi:MAG: hypothetical protein PUB59_05745 [Firmicutes bacterium]|nr:hypothetical protein [Bacillota bacterium]
MKVGCAVHALFDVGSYIDYFVSGEEDRSPYMYDNTVKSLQYQVLSTREKGSASLRKAFPRRKASIRRSVHFMPSNRTPPQSRLAS